MGWSPDPELRQMFMDELNERSARLLEGARTMRDGSVDSEFAGEMMREGHTIKGTARVLGFEAVSVGGLLVEQIWKQVQHDELAPSEELATALEVLARSVVGAGDADPDTGTIEHYRALTDLSALVPDIELPAVKPPDPTTAGEPADPASAPASEPPPSPSPVAASPPPAGAPPPPPPAAGLGESSPTGEPAGAEFARGALAAVARLRGRDRPQAPPGSDPSAPGSAAAATRAPAPEAAPAALDASVAPIAFEPGADAAVRPSADVDLLVESVGRWRDESTVVPAGPLNRLVNGLSDARAQAEALVHMAGALDGASGEPGTHLVEAADGLRLALSTLLEESLGLATVPMATITNTLPQLVRMLAEKLGKQVTFDIVGDPDVVVDRQVVERLSDPLRHVVVNAIVHGVEDPARRTATGKPEVAVVELRVALRDGTVEIELSDDGAGIDWAAIQASAVELGLVQPSDVTEETRERLLLLSGVGVAAGAESQGSGRGLALVAEAAEALGGTVRVASEPGAGTSVTVAVPAARALEELLLVEAGNGVWAIPTGAVETVEPIDEALVVDDGDGRSLDWEGSSIPVRSLSAVAGTAATRREQQLLVVHHDGSRAALTFGSLLGNHQMWVRHFGPSHAAPRHILGMAIPASGGPAVVLDAARLVERAHLLPDDRQHPEIRVLVVDDSRGARAVISGSLESAGLSPSTAGSVAEALEVLDEHEVDALVVDFSMPNADGIALVKEVRARKSTIPIIMLSAVADEEDQSRAKRAGVDAFFGKSSFQEGAIAEALWEMLDA